MDATTVITLICFAGIALTAFEIGQMRQEIKTLRANRKHTKEAIDEHDHNEAALFPSARPYHDLLDAQRDMNNARIKFDLAMKEFEEYRNLLIRRTNGDELK